MSSRIILLIALFLSMLSFRDKERRPVYLYRNSGFYTDYYIKIDNSFIYHERNKYVGNGAFGMLIGRYWTTNDIIDVRLRIDGRDTTFKYDLTKCNCDSLMIGKTDDFFVVLNEHQYPWFND